MKKLLFLICILSFITCSSDKEEFVESILEISNTEILFTASEESKSFKITSNETWTITQIPEWLSVDQKTGEGNGTIQLKIQENPKEEERTAILKIAIKDKSEELKVRQNAKNVTLSLSESELKFHAEPVDHLTFEIISNESWVIEDIPEWCSFSVDKGDGSSNITVSIEKNYDEVDRDATVRVKAGSKTEELKIFQEALNIELLFSSEDLESWFHSSNTVFSYWEEPASESIMIKSNARWTVKSNDQWCMPNIENGIENQLLTLNVTQNEGKSERSSEVTVTAGSKMLKIIVKQSGMIEVTDNPYQINLRDNSPRIGDELLLEQVEYVAPGGKGENVTWDFSNLKPTGEDYNVTYTAPPSDGTHYFLGYDRFPISEIPANSLYVYTAWNTMYYFQIKGNYLHALGHENPVTILGYNPRMISNKYPTYYNDYYKYDYKSKGLYSATVELSSQGYMEMTADGYGSIKLPSGTYNNVLRIKYVQTIDDFENYPYKTEYTIYKWYVKGYRYPVLETHRSIYVSDGSEVFSTGHYLSPEAQEASKHIKKGYYQPMNKSRGRTSKLESLIPIIQSKK